MANKIDSNLTGLSIAEEVTLGRLPGVGGADAVWRGVEPNSYSDFGGEISTVARAPINASRQRQKGTVTDLDASGGYNTDVTQNNMPWLLQGLLFADAHEKPDTLPLNGTSVTVTGVNATTYSAASGLNRFRPGHLILASGFSVSSNNGLFLADTVSAGAITTAKALSAEAAPPAGARLRAVGYEFASGDATLDVTGGIVTLATTTADMSVLGIIPGEWLFIGDDDVTHSFGTAGSGFARVKSISAHAITCDMATFAAQDDAGAGKTIRVYFGTVIRNEKDAALIKRRTYHVERTLGNDENGPQAEYLVGAVANELTLNVPMADKLNADVTFVALSNAYRTGTEGLLPGTRIHPAGEDAINTSSDVFGVRMYIHDNTTARPAALFGYVSEATLTINNNVTPNKAIGVLGGFDTSAGTFEVGGDATAYFYNVEAVKAIRNNADVGLYMLFGARNAGFLFDLPLLSLGGGRLSVEADNPITLPLEASGAENALGYTLLYNHFAYLPTVGTAS